MPITPPGNTLQTIQTKVRRLTRSPSQAQLSDQDLQNYINTFVVYDFPEILRTFKARTTFTFVCNPYQDVYYTDEASFVGAIDNQLYNFQNIYLTVHDPIYIAGYQSFFTQSREQFFGIYPQVNNIAAISGIGDGVTTQFSGIVQNINNFNPVPGPIVQQTCLTKNQVLFSSIDTNNEGLAMMDSPVVDTATGNPTQIGNLYTPSDISINPFPTVVDPTNFINYVTGQFVVTFLTAPAANQQIFSETVPQAVSLPQALLFYNNTFTLRPIPDKPYRVQMEAYVRPSALLATNQSPELEEYWQYISYGAALKIFQDRMDIESAQMIMPEMNRQERLCLRRTIVQNTNERVATIYTEQSSFGPGSGAWGWGGGPF